MVRSSRPLALIVIGSCAEVRDHVPELKYGDLSEMSLVVLDPLTKKYEEPGVRQHVFRWVPGRSTGGESLWMHKCPMARPSNVRLMCWNFCSSGIVGSFLAESYKAVTMSFIRLDPELQILAKYGKRVPSNRDLKETKDQSRWKGQFNSGHHSAPLLAGSSGH